MLSVVAPSMMLADKIELMLSPSLPNFAAVMRASSCQGFKTFFLQY
jgi:hypothetical protein